MQNAVIYARYSSSHQKEESIEGQLRECTAFAERENLNIVGTYIDRALTGKTDARPDFQKMIKDSATHAFQVVVVYQLDRFARNRYDSAVYKAKLKQAGVRVISAKESITTEPAGIILESVLEGMAEYYSAELAQKITRGMTDAALQGKWCGGSVPFGFKLDKDHKLIVDEYMRPWVEFIFKAYAANVMPSEIIAKLTENQVTTAKGKAFTYNTINRMIKREIYKGIYTWGKVKHTDIIPAIISPSLWQACQDMVVKRKKGNTAETARSSTIYALAGKLVCGHCGGHVVGMSGHGRHKKVYNYYCCHNARKKHTACELGNIPQEQLEVAVLQHTIGLLSSPASLDLIVEQTYSAYKSQDFPELDRLKIQIVDTTAKINNCMKAIERGLVSDTVCQRMQALEQELRDLQSAYDKEKLLSQPFDLTQQHIAYFLTRFAQLNPKDAKHYIFTALIKDIAITKIGDNEYKLVITYNYNSDHRQACSTIAVRIFSHMVERLGLNTNLIFYPDRFSSEFVFSKVA